MANSGNSGSKPGSNGFGRIGKLMVWHHVARKDTDSTPPTSNPKPPGRIQKEKVGKFRIRRLMVSLKITGIKIEIERKPTVKIVFFNE
jgi:hypothetical protein